MPAPPYKGLWRVLAWTLVGLLVAAGVMRAVLDGKSVMLLAPVDGEWVITWLIGIAAVIGLAFSGRTMVVCAERRPLASLLLLLVTAVLVVPVGVALLFIHSPYTCVILTMPDGSREWAACEFAPLNLSASYSLHHGNGFAFDQNPALRLDIPVDRLGVFRGDAYKIEEDGAGRFVLRYATERGGPFDGRITIPRYAAAS